MKRLLPLFFALCAGMAGTGCSRDVDPPLDKVQPADTVKVEPTKQQANPAELQHLAEIKSDFAAKLRQDNAFAFDLLRSAVTSEAEPNRMLSPLSISMALNMTLNGAAGETRDEMLAALRSDGYTPEQINAYSQKLLQALISVDPNTKLSIANSIWYKQGFPVLRPFIDTNMASYAAAIEEADFAAPATLDRINGWISDNTGGKIEKALGGISPDAVMYLINAIYFKSAWETAFDKAQTADRPFRNSDGTTPSVPTMTRRGSMKYGQDANAAYLELLYANQTFSMVLALPNGDRTIGKMIEGLTPENWDAALASLHEADVDLALPRFTFKGDYELNKEILPEMGMKRAFSENLADFSLLSSVSTYIFSVIHKTFIEVAEEGTEAAAVTIVGAGPTSVRPGPMLFHADRPFLFAIRENTTGTILFIGTVGQLGQ